MAQTGNDYYEFQYPYVLPDSNIVMEVAELLQPWEEKIQQLTPLEFAFISWWVEERSVVKAFVKMIHPAFPFNCSITGAQLAKRKTVRDFYWQLRQTRPFQTLYSADRIIQLLHNELKIICPDERKRKFYAELEDTYPRLGKIAPFTAEMQEADRYIKILELIARINGTNLENSSNVPSTGQSSDLNSVDRNIAEAKRLILNGETASS